MDEKFQAAEKEYFILRGKLQTKHITREQFETALKEQMVQDAQGRYWILGIDSGKWYVHDGNEWVQSEPPAGGDVPALSPTRPPSAPSLARKSSRLPVIAVVGCLAILCLSVAGIGLYIYFNPRTPRPTLVVIPPPTSLVEVSTPISALTPTREAIVDAVPTSTSEPTATSVPPTDTPIPPPTVPPTLAFAPGFYITALRTNPAKPVLRQDVFFDVRFLNATGGPRSYRWLIYIFKSDPTQQKNSLGETPSFPFTFPSGTGEIEIGTWRLGGGGGCQDFVARVAWLDDNKRPTTFTKPDGQMFEQPFSVCP